MSQISPNTKINVPNCSSLNEVHYGPQQSESNTGKKKTLRWRRV